MSKLLDTRVLLAALTVLLLSKELTAQTPPTFNITLVKDLREYKLNNHVVLWEGLNFFAGDGFILGNRNSDDVEIIADQVTFHYNLANNYSTQFPFLIDTTITYVKLKFTSKPNSGKVFVVDGGIGKNFISLVVEMPESKFAEILYFSALGNKVPHV